MGKDTKRYRKMRKDANRWEKMGIDSGLIGACGFSCVANVHVLLNCRFPYLGGRVAASVRFVLGLVLFLRFVEAMFMF